MIEVNTKRELLGSVLPMIQPRCYLHRESIITELPVLGEEPTSHQKKKKKKKFTKFLEEGIYLLILIDRLYHREPKCYQELREQIVHSTELFCFFHYPNMFIGTFILFGQLHSQNNSVECTELPTAKRNLFAGRVSVVVSLKSAPKL